MPEWAAAMTVARAWDNGSRTDMTVLLDERREGWPGSLGASVRPVQEHEDAPGGASGR